MLRQSTFCALLLIASESRAAVPYYHSVARAITANINAMSTTWKAGYNSFFDHLSQEEVRRMMGVKKRMMKKEAFRLSFRRTADSHAPLSEGLIPEVFDARQRWPMCRSIGEVREEGACAACHVFSVVETITDRICIATGGRQQPHISAYHPLSCCPLEMCGEGCVGGDPFGVWTYYKTNGVVSGGNYGSGSGCQPYTIPPCESNRSDSVHCKILAARLRCEGKCQKNYSVPFSQDKHYGTHVYVVDNNVEAIQREILSYGPVQATLNVYEDLLVYRTGVYRHHFGRWLGMHCVRIIGWGSESCIPYWLVTTSWGNNRIIKILRAENHCEIEDYVMAGIPKL